MATTRRVTRRTTLGFEPLESRRVMAQLVVGGTGTFTSIQSAVESAAPGDEVLINAGTYNENVDLSQMGKLVGGAKGNISLIGNEANVLISPTSGIALRTSVEGFHGDITIENLTIGSPNVSAARDSNAIRLIGTEGRITITDNIFREVADDSIVISKFGFQTNLIAGRPFASAGGDFHIDNNSFHQTGDAPDDRAIVIDNVLATSVIHGNTFDNVLGTAIRVTVPVGAELVGVIDDNSISGDQTFLATTQQGFSADVSGTADLSFLRNQLSDLGGIAVELQGRATAKLTSRLENNSLLGLGGSDVFRIETHDSAFAAGGLQGNVIDSSKGNGFSLLNHDAAKQIMFVQDNVLLFAGATVSQTAIVVANDANGNGSQNVSVANNTFSDSLGNGVSVTQNGAGAMTIAAIDNVFSQVNTEGGTAGLVVQNSQLSTGAVSARISGNRFVDPALSAIQLAQNGVTPIRLAGSASTAADELSATNDGGANIVSGQVTMVALDQQPPAPVTLGDTVWLDENGNSQFEDVENGKAYVELRIEGTDSTGQVIQRRTLTDSAGGYRFSGLLPASYTVTLVVPRGTELVSPGQGGDISLDSDFDQTSWQKVVQVGSEVDTNLDGGLWLNWVNPNNPLDVNNDGFVSPIDALLIINDINANQSRGLDVPRATNDAPPFLDTSEDGSVSPIDVLLIVNEINSHTGSGGEGESRPNNSNDNNNDALDAASWALQQTAIKNRNW